MPLFSSVLCTHV